MNLQEIMIAEIIRKEASGVNRQEIFAYVRKQYHVEADFPWADRNAVLRHPGNCKWFAAVLEVGRDKLGLSGEGMVDVINVKCEPLLIGSLRTQPGFHPAYHMNKDKWISIRLDGSVSEEEIRNLIDLSHHLTMPPKKRKNRLSGGHEHDSKSKSKNI